MPYIEFDKGNDNHGSVEALATYLSKEENEEQSKSPKIGFFDQERTGMDKSEVVGSIDNNIEKLGKKEAKFFSIIVSPSEAELSHLGKDDQKLLDYTRSLMDEYAKNFNKGLRSDDLLYFARIEHSRKLGRHDKEVINGIGKVGDLKSGDNRHVHVIVSRKTKSRFLSGERIVTGDGAILSDDPEKIKRAMTLKISPKANARGKMTNKLNNRTVRVGCDRHSFKVKGERLFDHMFQYERAEHEKYEYMNDRRKGLLGIPINELGNDLGQYVDDVQKETYIIDRVEQLQKKRHLHGSREGVEQFLKKNGIKFDGKEFSLKGHNVSKKGLTNGTKRFLDTVIVPLYLANEVSKSLDRAQRELDNENEKERT